MANKILPAIAPYIRAIFGQDDNDDFRVARVDTDGGILASYAGSYHAIYNEYATTTSTGAVNTYVTLAIVPVGELWVIQLATAHHEAAAARSLSIFKNDGATWYILNMNVAQPANVSLFVNGDILLKAGENILIRLAAGGANEIVRGYAVGYKVKLT